MKLALFFTEGVALKTWHEAGLLERDSLLYHHLARHGWEIYFVTYGEPDDSRYLPPDSPIKVLPKPAGMSIDDYGRSLTKIHGDVLRHVDVFKSHQVDGARYAAYASWRLRKPYMARCGYLPSYFIMQEGGGRRRRVQNWVEEFFAFHSATTICVPSQSEIDYLHQRYRIQRQKAHACPNWVDTERFKPDAAAIKNPRRICFTGRFHPQKDPLLLLEAIKGIENLELLMIGGGKLKPQIEAKIAEYKLKVILKDRVPNEELPHALNGSAIYVLPTLYEGGSPKTLLEAMACGVPVISTSAFGVDEAFEDGVHGVKCAPHDVAAFRAAILRLLDNPAEAQQLGQQGRQRILETYAIDRAVERERRLLERMART